MSMKKAGLNNPPIGRGDGVPALLAAWAAVVDLGEVLDLIEEHGDARTRQVVNVWKGTSRLAEVWPWGAGSDG